MTIEERPVSLREIVESPLYQVRSKGIDPATVTRYAQAMESGAEFPPIDLRREPSGALVLLSGAHRVRAARRAGLTELEARIHEIDDAAAMQLAIDANGAHGLPLTTADRKKALALFYAAKLHHKGTRGRGRLSYREIQAKLGGLIAFTTLHRWTKQHHPRIARELGGEQGPRGSRGTEPLERARREAIRRALGDQVAALRSFGEAPPDPEMLPLLLREIEAVAAGLRDKGIVPASPESLDF